MGAAVRIRRYDARPGDRVVLSVMKRFETYGGGSAVETGQRKGTIVAVDPLSGFVVLGDSGLTEVFRMDSDAIVGIERQS